MEHLAAGGLAQVEGKPALVPIVDDPAVVVGTLGHTGPAHAMAIGVSVGWLDLDDVGAEVGQDRRGHGAGDEARRIHDTQTRQQGLTHWSQVLASH